MAQEWGCLSHLDLQRGAVPFVSYIEVHVSLFNEVSWREKKPVVCSRALRVTGICERAIARCNVQSTALHLLMSAYSA